MKRSYQPERDLPVLETNLLYAEGGTVSTVTRLLPYERHGKREALLALQQGRPMVYAARVEDGLIKIGCSIDIYRRMIQLRGELLGFMFGDLDDERMIHETLAADLNHGREWFNPTPAVMAVVNDLRAGLGLEPLAA